MKPSVGRIVHYKDGEKIFAAIIVHVWSGECVSLQVFMSHINSIALMTSVTRGDADGQWNWPDRVE